MADRKNYDSFAGSRGEMSQEQSRKVPHKPWFLALIIINVLCLVVVFIFNGLAAQGPDSGVFVSTTGNQSDKYNLEVTPAGWTFTIWGFIYAWQAAWVLYSVVNLFRTTSLGPVYLTPEIIPPATFVLYILSSGFNVAWLLLFDRDHIEASFAVLALTPIVLGLGLAACYRALDLSVTALVGQGRVKDIWLVRGLVHNGLGIYATWTSVAAFLNLAMVIAYTKDSDVSVKTASTVALVLLSVEVVVYVATDLILLDRYSRYTFTPYIVVIVALSGIISKNWESGETNAVFSAVLLGVGVAAFLVKIVLSVYRHATRPPYFNTGEVKPTLDSNAA